ncbi:DUF3667 domain-containing protein [Emcibacter nanhaiensis]|uniref:DUF3667 domain-containing protein n=1 Tax=Emcibacter nanhaiensis TaxID=1505037 RepID=A0A501PBT4_9PROT|nr:DUF3667 domain-containing protein [Emcibacter nanhaiensis]TPD57658.1 DUF3667 domain-containing protein [Emcibacter nanhaiensis]
MQKEITADEPLPAEAGGEQTVEKSDTGLQADAAYEEYKSCENCHTRLYGKFCASCGQKDVNFLRPVWMLLEDALGDLFSFDSRFYRTLHPLMFRPGYITREYLKGKRARFVPPFRQYLVISLLFFLALVTSDVRLFETKAIDYDPLTDENLVISGQGGGDKPGATPETATENSTVKPLSDLREQERKEIKDSVTVIEISDDSDTFLKEQLSRLIKGWNRISEDPTLMNKLMADWIPRVMFVLLPVYAMIFKLTYIFNRRYYFEHLVFSLHAHAFVFLLFTVMVLLYQYAPFSRPYLAWLLLYIPLYLLIAMKTVYNQGWFKTVVKASFIAFVYFMLLISSIIPAIGYGLTRI